MTARDDARLGQPAPTGEPLDHLCPICGGEGDSISVYCVCEGLGVVNAERARELAAEDPDPQWQPKPLDPVPPFTGQKCHDCAFRAGSLERDGKTAAELYDHMTLANNGEQPFYCHQGMHHGAQGYVPRQRDRSGMPIGHAVCAGWVQVYTARQPR